jgi:hypothetical protein
MVSLHKNEDECTLIRLTCIKQTIRCPSPAVQHPAGANIELRVYEFDVFSAGDLKCICRIRGDVEDASDVASAGSHSLTL